jgi:hypothetical protein
MLAQVGWVVFWTHPSRNIASSFVSAIAFVTLTFWVMHTKYKWGGFLKKVVAAMTSFNVNMAVLFELANCCCFRDISNSLLIDEDTSSYI